MAKGKASTYELNIEHRPMYLYACVRSETISREMVVEYMEEVFAEFRKGQFSRLLLKKEISAQLKVSDYPIVARKIIKAGAQGIRIAVVDEFPEHVEVNDLGATKARKAGLEIQFFTNFPAGVHWLLRG